MPPFGAIVAQYRSYGLCGAPGTHPGPYPLNNKKNVAFRGLGARGEIPTYPPYLPLKAMVNTFNDPMQRLALDRPGDHF